MKIGQVSKLTGVSIRTLRHYDAIGLLKPSAQSESGYRLYDETDLQKLHRILMYRELEFPLKKIKMLLERQELPFSLQLDAQISMLKQKKAHIENLLAYANELKKTGGNKMNFQVFEKETIDRYEKEAAEQYGNTAEYREYRNKAASYGESEQNDLVEQMMQIFSDLGAMRSLSPESDVVQAKIGQLRAYISSNFYQCSKTVFAGLAELYVQGGEMTENINKAGGEGTAEFAASAIRIYCR